MSVSERLLKARKVLDLTQADFAKPLGIDRGYISTLEHGSRTPSETLLRLIGHEHGISVTWLKTGEGGIFVSPEEAIKNLKARYGEQTFQKAVLEMLSNNEPDYIVIPPEDRAKNKTLLPVKESSPLHPREIFITPIGKTEYSNDPRLKRIFDTLNVIWSAGDENLKGWAVIQFSRAFPDDIIEEAQKKHKETYETSTG